MNKAQNLKHQSKQESDCEMDKAQNLKLQNQQESDCEMYKARNHKDQRPHGSESERDETNVPFSSRVEPISDDELDQTTIITIDKNNKDFTENGGDRVVPNRRRPKSKSCNTGICLLICIVIICNTGIGVIVWIRTSHHCSHKEFTMASSKPTMTVAGTASPTVVVNTQCFVVAELDVSKLNKNYLLYWQIEKKNGVDVDSGGSNFTITQNGTYDIYTRLNLVSSSSYKSYQHAVEVIRFNGERNYLDFTKETSRCRMHCHSDLRNQSVWLQEGDKIKVTMTNQGIVEASKPTHSYFELKKIY